MHSFRQQIFKWFSGIGALLKISILFLWVLAVWANPTASRADTYQVRSWYKENGLPDNVVTALAQTRDGYLWIGTPGGLVRFDGEHIKAVEEAGYADSLEDSNVVALAADPGGNLWIASASGLITELAEGQFRVRYRPPEATDAYRIAGGNAIMRNWRGLNSIFALDTKGRVCALTIAEGVVRFDGSGAAENIAMDRLPPGMIAGLASDSTGQLWLLKGTNAVALEDDRWSYCTNGPISYSGKLLCPSTDRGFWTARKTATKAFANLVQKNGEQWTMTTIPLPKEPFDYPVAAMLQDHLNRFWLAFSTEGLFVDNAGKGWTKAQIQGPLEKCSVRCLYEDKSGSIWVGTSGEGLHQILDPLVKMTMLPPEAANVHVTSVSLGRTNVWMGTDRGLYAEETGDSTGVVTAVDPLSKESVYAVLEDSHSNVWVGTRSGIFLRKNETFEKILTATNGGFLALFEDRDGNVWAGGFHNAVYHFHDGTNDFICKAPKKRALAICCMAQDSEGQIWLMTRGSGLWQVRKKNLIAVDAVGPEINGDNPATAVLCDDNHGVWVSTLDNGIFRWSNGKLQQFTAADGMPDNGILGMAEDSQGNLWISCRNGIFGCPLLQLTSYEQQKTGPLVWMQLGVDDGMADQQCTGAGQPVISKGFDGRFAVATTVGAAKFLPATVGKNTTPECFIEALNVDGRISAGANVRVLADSRHFEFEYAAPELISPQKLHFRYRLDGLDQSWTDAGKERTAVYNRLPPGKYHFRVMVSGGNGSWREASRQFNLQVVPFFWQTWWFQLLALVAVIALVSGGVAMQIRRRAQRSLERLEAQRAVEHVRQHITRDLHDELGSAITEIIQISDFTLEPNPGPDILRTKMNSITDRVRRLSIKVDEIVWTMSSRNDTLRSLVGYMSNHAQEFFRHSNIRCRLDVSTNLPEVVVDSQRRHNLYLATKEALNNVAKHSSATEVILRAHYIEQVLRISVEDNGRGFDASSERNGEGLTNMQERLEVLGGNTTFSTPPKGGSVVTFTLNLAVPSDKSTSHQADNAAKKNHKSEIL